MDCQFDQFLVFCEGYLGSSKKNFLDLIQKRYEECDEEYKESDEFADYLLSTEAKIRSDEPRFFVHLKQFLNILKENKVVSHPSKSNGLSNSKRTRESSGSENEERNLNKRRKLYQSTDSDSSLPGGMHLSEQNCKNSGRENIHKEVRSVSDISSENSEKEEGNKNDEETQSWETQEPSDDMESEPEAENSGIKTQQSHEKQDTGVKKLNIEPGKTRSDETEADDPNIEKVTRNTENDNEESNSQSDKSEIFTAVPLHISEKSHAPHNDDEDNMFSSSGEESETDANNARNIESIIEQQEEETETENSKLDESCVTVVGEDSFYERNTDISVNIEENDNDSECDSDVLSSLSGACSNSKVNHSQGKNDKLNVNNDIIQPDADSGEDIFGINEENLYSEKSEKQSNQRTEEQDEVNKKNTTVGNKLPVDEDEDSDEVIELNSSGEQVCEDGDNVCEEDSIMVNTTENFIDKNKDTSNEVTEREADKSGPSINKTLKRNVDIYSSDEEDPDYAKKAKKFREKCKKKYVISVGKKKHNSFSEEHQKKKILKRPGFNCPKVNTSPKKKKTPDNSPKKKISPKKSPIIIVSESESGSDVENVEDFKKRIEEKIDSKFREKYHIEEDPILIIDKIHVKLEETNEDSNERVSEENNEDEVADDTGDEILTNALSLKDNDSSNKKIELKEEIKSDVNEETKQDKYVEKETKTTKRISFFTEELYSNDKNADEPVNEDSKETSVRGSKDIPKESESKENRNPKTKSEDSKKHGDEPKPGPSSAPHVDDVKKKGSTKQIRKLEALLESIRDQIERVRTRELDLDEMDSEVSDYILEDKLQRKFVKVFDKLCELHNASKHLSVGRPVDKYFRYEGTRYPDINRKIEKFVNKRKEFPDYSDIRGIIIRVNKRKKLHLVDREIDDLAREAFTDVGNRLQKRRQKDFISTFHTQDVNVNMFSLYDDPALYDPELKKKLDSNKKTAKSNMDKVVEKYAALQYQVGDKTDDENDDDEEEEENNVDADELDQLSGVDNSESDTGNGDELSIKHGITSSVLHSWKSGPCLEIENLEDECKSKILKSDEDIKHFSPMKPKLHRENGCLDPKAVHFSDQLGLTPTTPRKEKISITILSDNDDDNEVKFDPNENPYNSRSGSDVEVGCDGEDLSSPDNENNNLINEDFMIKSDEKGADNTILEEVNLLNNPSCLMEMEGNVTLNRDDSKQSNAEHAVLTTNNEEDVTVIIDEDDENEDNSMSNEEPFPLKIVSAHHVSIEDISKLHGEEETAETLPHEEQEVQHVLEKREDIAVTEINISERESQNHKIEELSKCTPSSSDEIFANLTEKLELNVCATSEENLTTADAGKTEPVAESEENRDICTSNKADPEPEVIVIDCPTVQMDVKVTDKNISEIHGDKESKENPDIIDISKDKYPQECSIISETWKTDGRKDEKFHEMVDTDKILSNSGDNIEFHVEAKHKDSGADTCTYEIVGESKQNDVCTKKRHDSEPDVIVIDDSALKKIRTEKQHTNSDCVKRSPKLNGSTNNCVQGGINKGNSGPQNYSELLSVAAKNCGNKLKTLSQPGQRFQTGSPGQDFLTYSQRKSQNRNPILMPQNTSQLISAENVGQKMQGKQHFNHSGAQKSDLNLLHGVETNLKDYSPVNLPGGKNYNLNKQSCQKISFDMQGHQKSNIQLQGGQVHRLGGLNSNFNLQSRLNKLNEALGQKSSFRINSGQPCNFTSTNEMTNFTTQNSQSQNLGVSGLSKFSAQFGINSKSNVHVGISNKFVGQGRHGQQGTKQYRSEKSTSKMNVTDDQKMKRTSSSVADVVIIDDETESTKLPSVQTKGSINQHPHKLTSQTAENKSGAKSKSIKVTDSKGLESKGVNYVHSSVGDKKNLKVKSKSTSNSTNTEDMKRENYTQRQSKTSVKDANKKSRVIPDNCDEVICLDAELDTEIANCELNNEQEKDSDRFSSVELTHNTGSESVQSTNFTNGSDTPVKMSSDKNDHVETNPSSDEITDKEAVKTSSEEQIAQTPSDIFDGSSSIEDTNDFSTIEQCNESELFEKVSIIDSVVDCVPDETCDSGTAKKNYKFKNTHSTEKSNNKTTCASVDHVDNETGAKSNISVENKHNAAEANVNITKVSKKTESNAENTGLVQSCKTKTCDLMLKTVENGSDKTRTDSVNNKTSPLKEKKSPKKVHESDLASLGAKTDNNNCHKTASHVPTACHKNKHSKSTLSANCVKSTEIQEDMLSADDMQSSDGNNVSVNILDNETSLDSEHISKVKVNPHIRNKLLQLKEVIESAQPQVETINSAICEPVETRDVVVVNEGDPQWGEKDENAGLIETYQEPDSTPFHLREHTVSSSNNDKIIVLSDSE